MKKIIAVALAVAVAAAGVLGYFVIDKGNKLTAIQTELTEAQDELSAMLTEKEKLQAELETVRNGLTAKETELADTQSELAAAQTDLTAAQDALSAKETELAGVQSELATAQTDLTAAQDALTAKETELADTQSELATAQSDLTAAQDALTAKETELADTQSELATAQNDLAEAQSDLTAKETELAGAQSELASAQKTIAAGEIVHDGALLMVMNENSVEKTVDEYSFSVFTQLLLGGGNAGVVQVGDWWEDYAEAFTLTGAGEVFAAAETPEAGYEVMLGKLLDEMEMNADNANIFYLPMGDTDAMFAEHVDARSYSVFLYYPGDGDTVFAACSAYPELFNEQVTMFVNTLCRETAEADK